MEGGALERRLSSLSSARLKTLAELEGRVRNLEDSLTEIEGMQGVEAKAALRQLVGHLDKLQFGEIDAIVTTDLHSGRQSAKFYRKALHARVDAMREHVDALYVDRQEDVPLSASVDASLGKVPIEEDYEDDFEDDEERPVETLQARVDELSALKERQEALEAAREKLVLEEARERQNVVAEARRQREEDDKWRRAEQQHELERERASREKEAMRLNNNNNDNSNINPRGRRAAYAKALRCLRRHKADFPDADKVKLKLVTTDLADAQISSINQASTDFDLISTLTTLL